MNLKQAQEKFNKKYVGDDPDLQAFLNPVQPDTLYKLNHGMKRPLDIGIFF